MKKIKTWQWLLGIIILSLVIFFPSFKTFYTNDDFYHFVVSHADNIKDFVNFFNLFTPATGFSNYRPLTIQVPYFIDWKFFNLNPLFFHTLSFIIFSAAVVLVYRLVKMLTRNDKIALLSTFLYATSASHFGHLYIAAPAEIGFTFFALLSIILFFEYLLKNNSKNYLLSIVFFILGLMAKENAIIIPTLLFLIYLFHYLQNKKKVIFKKTALLFTPFALLLTGYLYLRFFHYGLAAGDSYVWNYSPIKALNTLFWYKVWSLNLPEMLVDFVGPGLTLNPNLMKYYSKEIFPILVLFGAQVLIILSVLILILKRKVATLKSFFLNVAFGVTWFVLALVPVLFLPIHKFTFYLALPFVGFAMVLATILSLPKISNKLTAVFLCLWLASSFLALKLTYKTNWITRGAETSKRVYSYFKENYQRFQGKTILFYDTEADRQLPWSPTLVLKNTLSENNFFLTFFGGKISARYEKGDGNEQVEKVQARQFLGY